MTDIVERLRNAVPFTADPLHSDLQEAADEIERLRGLIEAEGVEIERLCGEAEAIPRWVRNDALEEAAKYADDQSKRADAELVLESDYDERNRLVTYSLACSNLAAAIRVMKEVADG